MSCCKMERFQYKGLLDEDHIRVIELLPGTEDNTIKCHLTSEFREITENTYDAISYVWGDPTKTVDIICCDAILSITTSLADALKMIRSKSPKTSHRLWADAICINQRSSEEKNHQVKRIGQVYRNARCVLAWLGPDDDGIASACFNLIKKMNLYFDKQFDIYKHTLDIPSFEPPRLICDDPAMGSNLRSLMGRSWFSRVWVIQEAGLAKDCHLLWGNQTMGFAELIEFACFCDGRTTITRLMGSDYQGLGLWRHVFRCVYRTYNVENSWKCSKPLIQSLYKKHLKSSGLFLDVLQIGRSMSAADPRDHIYAFIGNSLAVSSEGGLLLEPNYSKENKLNDVYFDTVCALLRSRHESPYVLCFAQHSTAGEVIGSDGPSWVPRWRKPETGSIPFFTIGNIGVSHIAGGSANKLKYRVSRGCGVERLLTLQGIMFDSIAWTSDLLKPENFALTPDFWDVELRAGELPYIEVMWNHVCIAFKQRQGRSEQLDFARYQGDFSFTLVTGYQNSRALSLKEHRKIFRAYLHALRLACNPEEGARSSPLPEKKECNASRYERATRNCGNRRLAITNLGHFALVPQFAQPGDVCCAFLGMVTPFVLRPAATQIDHKGKYYHLVGEAYIHSVMSGQLPDALENGDIEENEITLV